MKEFRQMIPDGLNVRVEGRELVYTPIEEQCEFEIGDVIVSSDNIIIFEGIHNDCVMSSHHLFTSTNSFHVETKTHRQKIHEYVKATGEQEKLFNIACLSNSVWFDRVNKKWINIKDGEFYSFATDDNNAWIGILKRIANGRLHTHIVLEDEGLLWYSGVPLTDFEDVINISAASEEQKQTLTDVIAKDGKRWNADKKCVEKIC